MRNVCYSTNQHLLTDHFFTPRMLARSMWRWADDVQASNHIDFCGLRYAQNKIRRVSSFGFIFLTNTITVLLVSALVMKCYAKWSIMSDSSQNVLPNDPNTTLVLGIFSNSFMYRSLRCINQKRKKNVATQRRRVGVVGTRIWAYEVAVCWSCACFTKQPSINDWTTIRKTSNHD